MDEQIKITGEFHAKIFENGKLVKEYTDKNLVVTAGKVLLAAILEGSTGAALPLGRIGFGTDGTAPALTDTTLTGSFIKGNTGNSHPEAGAVRFDWELLTSENNGVTIREFGLMWDNDALFARKVGLTITKTNVVSAVGYWTIKFT